MIKTIYKNKQGLGIITKDDDSIDKYVNPINIQLENELLIPNKTTSLTNLYTEEITYVGVLKDDPTCMVFYLGNQSNLFESYQYYSCWYFLSPGRIANKYTDTSARDYHFKNGIWK